MTRCFVIRHAEKEEGDFYNPRLRHQDEPISHKGRHDAQKLLSFFSDKPISAIYVSAFQRTLQTIAYVAQQLKLTPSVDDRLNEIDNGSIEGMTEQEIEQTYPYVWNAYRQRTTDFRFPDGETGEEAERRIVSFLEERRRLHESDDIIMVSHDGLIRLLMCSIVHVPVFERWNFQVDTCGIMEIVSQPDADAWKLIRFNQVCTN